MATTELSDNVTTVAEVAGVVVALALVLTIALVLTRAIITAGRLPPPASLVVALAVLTLLAIAGGIATDNDEAWAITAAGIGALAGSVTAQFQRDDDEPKGPEP